MKLFTEEENASYEKGEFRVAAKKAEDIDDKQNLDFNVGNNNAN